MRAVLLMVVVFLGALWAACSRPQQREPVIGVTPRSELVGDETAPLPDAGWITEPEEDAGYGDAGEDATDADLTYDEAFSDGDSGTDGGVE